MTGRSELVPSELSKWRVEILRTLLMGAGFALLLLCVLQVLGSRTYRGSLTIQEFLVGGAMLLASRYAAYAPRLLSWLFAIVAMLLVIEAIYLSGWSPSAVAGLISVLIYVGLLLGRLAAWCLVTVAFAIFMLRGLSIARTGVASQFFPDVSTTHWINWNREAGIFAAITAATGWGLGRIGLLLAQWESRLHATVALVREHCALLESAILRRTKSERWLRDVQKLQSVAQLGQGFARLFNDILTIIGTGIESVRKASSNDELTQGVRAIREAVSAAAYRTRDLLTLSKPHGTCTSSLNLEDTFSQLGPKLRSRLRANVELFIDSQAQGRIFVSELWLDQVLTNLLLNAEQAMPDGGRIDILVRPLLLDTARPGYGARLEAGWYAVIRVLDTGHGMSDEVRERATEPFFTTRSADEHQGLGLTIAGSMVADANGLLEVEYRERGASIAIYLPCQTGADASPQRAQFGATTYAPHAEAAREIETWQSSASQLVIRLYAICTAVAISATEVYAQSMHTPTRTHLMIGVPAVVSFVLAGWFWPRTTRTRMLWFMATAIGTSSAFVTWAGFMTPTPVALGCMAILFTWMLGERKIAMGGIAASTVALIVAGYFHSRGQLVSLPMGSLSRPENWYRVGVNLTLVAIVACTVVLHVLGLAQKRVASLLVLEANLRETKEQLQAQSDATVNIEAMAERAAHLESMGRVTGMIAHDLNNSLSALGVWADVIQDERMKLDSVELPSILDSMEDATQLSAVLVSSLELQSPRIRGSTPVGQLTTKMGPMLCAVLRNGQQLSINDDSRTWARIDEHSYRRVLFNLVTNARDAMATDGHCRISVSDIEQWIEISVEDNGCGMAPETMERAFEMFFTTKGSSGTGIGLHSVASLIHSVGGYVEVQSKLNEGTRITLRIPQSKDRRQQLVASMLLAEVKGAGSVLLVEGHAKLREMLCQRLVASGFEVRSASSEIAAFEHLGDELEYAGFCIDSSISGKSARYLIEEFLRRFPGSRVVLMSGYYPNDWDEFIKRKPEIRLMRKPFVASELVRYLACGI